ncbi:hypothetical protein [Chryseolinea lacunae]|uniref:DUF4401 domain-containing protein n=1 Tax=Chryseolinea lacunae TaxID=2801331 RepID=A0ABS1KRZ3_9BACT|nr:hypothetical protein [Chryseolinea lacunae]MBL0741987.1 hypothetical protein [Chryseolinea lacunae]
MARKTGRWNFTDLLSKSIVPKVLWFSTAISLIGLFIMSLQPSHNSYLKMFFIGGISILIGVILILYAALKGTKHLGVVVPVLCRAIPVGLLDAYFLCWN